MHLTQVAPLPQDSSLQLPVDWYVDPKIYAMEQAALSRIAPQYVGHELLVPNLGDYCTLEWQRHGKVIIHNRQGYQLISNVCRHRQAIMLQGKGNTSSIVCPIHRWTYNLQGELLGAPHFKNKPCLNLQQTTLQSWNGLLFNSPRNIADDLKNVPFNALFDFEGYHFHRTLIQDYAVNWKTFIEVYLEDYHVAPFHPGLGQFVDCDHLQWHFDSWCSAQLVALNDHLNKPGSPTYQKWHERILRYSKTLPEHGAVWLLYYPYLMVEWYPHVLVISHIVPTSVSSCRNIVEFYYPEDIALFEPELVAAEQAAYIETAIEDQEICERMQQGREYLYEQGINEYGPYQQPMETGMEHFHTWIRTQLGAYLNSNT